MSKNAWLYIYAYNILYQYIIRLKIYQESLKRILHIYILHNITYYIFTKLTVDERKIENERD